MSVQKMYEQSLTTVIEELEKLFSIFNTHFFDGELIAPVITTSPDTTRGAYGWCTGWKAWKTGEKDEGRFEINLCAEYLDRPFEETCGTLLHEMVHLLNCQLGIQDTSRGGFYHNKRFKIAAEDHGMAVEKTKNGYSKTTLTPDTEAFIQTLNKPAFTLVRPKIPTLKGASKAGNSRKYVCPGCGAIVRATKEVRIICAECDVEFKLEV